MRYLFGLWKLAKKVIYFSQYVLFLSLAMLSDLFYFIFVKIFLKHSNFYFASEGRGWTPCLSCGHCSTLIVLFLTKIKIIDQ